MTNETKDPILSIRGLTKRFAGHTAVSDLSLDIRPGEFVALLGPSGCGKSTTLMAVAGFIDADEGQILLEGRDITRAPPEARSMGVVFQDYALFPHLSVLDNVAFPLRMRGVPRREREERARQALAQVQLPEQTYAQRPGQLSGGQRQRVAVARAIVYDPLVLLMDEPLAALDRRLRQHMQFELRHLQAKLGTTVIYVTHDQEEALVLADRIVVMRNGVFEQVGPPRTLYDEPANAFVAGFLGESNGLPVRVLRAEAGIATVLPVNGDGPKIEVPACGCGDPEALLVVRPENLRLSGASAPRDGAALAARVKDVAFLGDRLRVELDLALGATWTAVVAARSGLDGLPDLKPGSPVFLSWRTEDGRLVRF